MCPSSQPYPEPSSSISTMLLCVHFHHVGPNMSFISCDVTGLLQPLSRQ